MKTDVITRLTQLAAVQLSEEAVQEGKVRVDCEWKGHRHHFPKLFYQMQLLRWARASAILEAWMWAKSTLYFSAW